MEIHTLPGNLWFLWQMLVSLRGSREKGRMHITMATRGTLCFPRLPFRGEAALRWTFSSLTVAPCALVPHRVPSPYLRTHRSSHLVLVPVIPSHVALRAASQRRPKGPDLPSPTPCCPASPVFTPHAANPSTTFSFLHPLLSLRGACLV